MTRPFQVRFTDEQRAKLDTLASQAGVPVGVVIRWAVDYYNPKSLFLGNCPMNSQIDQESEEPTTTHPTPAIDPLEAIAELEY